MSDFNFQDICNQPPPIKQKFEIHYFEYREDAVKLRRELSRDGLSLLGEICQSHRIEGKQKTWKFTQMRLTEKELERWSDKESSNKLSYQINWLK